MEQATIIHIAKYPKGEIETIYTDKGLYLRAFIGKGSDEVCYKTKYGDTDTLIFAIKLGFEK